MANALELLKSAATAGVVGGQSPLEIFYSKLDQQVKLAGEVKDGKTHKTRSLWFRKDRDGYVVRIGRNAFEVAGSKLFRAADLDAVVAILTAAKEAIAADDKLQAVIAKHSAERSARLKAGRAKKAKK
ncbi:hypothetical protein [Rhizobium sp. L43]|uniref:hypothetical protein n=1 Tax=Rhizobium sp. L43 TaxID=2035452 RepID=UPI000BE99C86|nr:hypothetical protein [Rhizobium sp. L43]PDS75450.1 hypothetical protein CO667_26575 [Rhizobium sp. L43]